MAGLEQKRSKFTDTVDEHEINPTHGWTPCPVDDVQAEKLSSAELLQLLGAWQESNNVTICPRDRNHPLRQFSTLCSHCQNLVELLPAASLRKIASPALLASGHYNHERDLHLSAEAGCGMCIQLLKGCVPGVWPWLEWEDKPAEFSVHETIAFAYRNQADWTLMLRIPVFDRDKETIFDRYHRPGLDSISGPNIRDEFLPSEAVLYESPEPLASTKDALPLAKEWLNVCLTSHKACNREPRGRFIPTRLVDLSGPEPRLQLGSNIEEGARYATLSHCWGTQPFETLTKQSLVEFLRHIPLRAFTKTFRNGMEVVRYIGLKYLWIDSLCIIQNDQSDWLSESSLMADVYGNSALNLAASGAVDGSVGLFFSRKTRWRSQFQAHIENRKQVFDCYPAYGKWSLDGPLLSRGWALQERLLSRRTVHFAQAELFWECHELTASALFPYGCPVHFELNLPKQLLTKHWSTYISTYSRTNLTLGKDKLVAISGIARMISEISKDEYIVGLWQSDMVYQLPWWSTSPDLSPRPALYRAPSWSWASIDTQVLIPGYADDRRKVTRYYIKVEYLTPSNPFGEVVGATLRLRCNILCRGFLEPDWYMAPGNLYCRISPSLMACKVYFDSLDDLESFLPDSKKAPNAREDGNALKQEEVYVLPLYAYKDDENEESNLGVKCLVLLPTGMENRQYKRIGICDSQSLLEIYGEKAVEDDFLSAFTDSGVHESEYTEMSTDEKNNRERFVELI